MSEQSHLSKIFNKLIIVISIGILGHLLFLLLTTDRSSLASLSKLKFPYVLLILGLIMLPWLGHSLRMFIWSSFLKFPLRFTQAFRIAVTADLGAAITPTIIGGGPIKLGLLMQRGMSAGKAGTLTLLGTVEDLIMYTIAFASGCFFLKDTIVSIFISFGNYIRGNGLVFLGLLIFFVLLPLFYKKYFVKSLRKRLPEKFIQNINQFKSSFSKNLQELKTSMLLILKEAKLRFLFSFSILLCQWVAKFTVLIVVLSALQLDFNTLQMYLQQWLVYLSMIFVPTPGATGGAEASFYLIFNGEIEEKLLPLIISVWRFFTYYCIMFFSILFVQLFGAWDLRKRK